MTIGAADLFATRGLQGTLDALVAQDGSGTHPYLLALSQPRAATRDLADAVHLLCTLHGRLPGVVDMAAERTDHPRALEWLLDAVAGFAEERAQITRLVVAAGPLPSTPGQAESESAVLGQRHALEMLARSERRGCAIGAALALVLDWPATRLMLDVAADRFGVSASPPQLPGGARALRLADAVSDSASIDRALFFGAQQLLVQHRGLWSLLDARRGARDV